MNAIIAKLTGKTLAGYAIMTRMYYSKGRLQSGPVYATRKEAATDFAARGFKRTDGDRIVALWV